MHQDGLERKQPLLGRCLSVHEHREGDRFEVLSGCQRWSIGSSVGIISGEVGGREGWKVRKTDGAGMNEENYVESEVESEGDGEYPARSETH